jgi:hypothetical protein
MNTNENEPINSDLTEIIGDEIFGLFNLTKSLLDGLKKIDASKYPEPDRFVFVDMLCRSEEAIAKLPGLKDVLARACAKGTPTPEQADRRKRLMAAVESMCASAASLSQQCADYRKVLFPDKPGTDQSNPS